MAGIHCRKSLFYVLVLKNILRQTHKSSPYVRQLGLDSRTVNPIDIHILYALQKHRYKSALSLKFSEPKRITLDFINKHNIFHQFSFFHPYIVYIRPILRLSPVSTHLARCLLAKPLHYTCMRVTLN